MGYKTFGTITWILTVMCVCPSAAGPHGKPVPWFKYLISQESSSVEDIDCKPPWQQLHRTCVLFNKTKFVDWQEARNSCLDAGADLLTINDIQKDTKIKDLLNEHARSRDLFKWWIGIRQINRTWLWVDNDQLYGKLPEWGENQNRQSLKDQCGVIQGWGSLVPAHCSTEKRPFICEQIKLTPPSTSPSTTTVSKTQATPVTPYPVPTPNILTPSTRLYPKFSTNKPTENPTLSISSPTTKEDTDSSIYKPTETPTTSSKDKQTNKPNDKSTSKPTDKPTSKPTDKPVTDHLADYTSEKTTVAAAKTTEKHKEEKDLFQGCYAVNYESICPPVEAFGISWPRSEAGKMVIVPCNKGQAKWKCDKNPVCWKEEPDVKQCTSESIQELTTQMEEFLSNTSDSEKVVAFTENLASSVKSESVMSEQDIYQSTKLMSAASNAKPKNSTEATNIIKNVAKCGSLLVGKEKKSTWESMTKESQRTVASSLLSSMESVTNNMLKSFIEPTVQKIEEENMAIELQVIKLDTEGHNLQSAVFGEESNSFAIPTENLKRFNKDGLARVVFIKYDNVGELLVPDNNLGGNNTERQIISEVISASLDDKPEESPLIKPVIFTMKTKESAKNQEWKQLCSFWNFSLGYTGAWSQKGCSLKTHNETHTTCQCNHLTNFAILMDVHNTKMTPVHATTLTYITYVGIIISIICLFLAWISFVCLR